MNVRMSIKQQPPGVAKSTRAVLSTPAPLPAEVVRWDAWTGLILEPIETWNSAVVVGEALTPAIPVFHRSAAPAGGAAGLTTHRRRAGRSPAASFRECGRKSGTSRARTRAAEATRQQQSRKRSAP